MTTWTLQPALDTRDTLRGAGVNADLDPALVNLPGVWVQVTSLDLDAFGATRNVMQLMLIVGDQDATQAQAALVGLLEKVAAAIPVHHAAARTVLLPDGTRLPGLAVPFAAYASIT